MSVPAPPGWYADPTNPAQWRYWTGYSWTATVAPMAPPAPLPATAGSPYWTVPSPPVRNVPFRPLRGLSTALTVLFIVVAAAACLSILAAANRLWVVEDLRNGRPVSFNRTDEADAFVEGALTVEVLTGLAIAIVIIVWLWRAYTNIGPLGAAPTRYGRGFTIGAWFIPVGSLFMPKQLINDCWRAADPSAPGNPAWTRLRITPIITVWWGLYLAAIVLYPGSIAATDASLDEMRQADVLAVIDAALVIPAAICGAISFHRITRRQHERAAALGISPD